MLRLTSKINMAPLPLLREGGSSSAVTTQGSGEGGGGGVLVSVGKDRLLRLWDLRSGAIARCLPADNSDVAVACSCFSMCFSSPLLPPQETMGGDAAVVGGVLAIAGAEKGSGPCIWTSGAVGF